MNPRCPNCGSVLRVRKMMHKGKMADCRGYSRFWVCDRCRSRFLSGLRDLKWRWKVGGEVIAAR